CTLALEQRPQRSRGEYQANHREIRTEQAVANVRQSGPLTGTDRRGACDERSVIRSEDGQLAPHRQEAQRRKHRQQKPQNEQSRADAPIERSATEGKMNTQASVQPSGRQERELPAFTARCP